MVWAEIAVAALAGSAFYGIVSLIERAATFWHPSFRQARRAVVHMKEDTCMTEHSPPRSALGGRARHFAADPVTLQLKWVTQAQFGGYYVAKDKGFYDDEGLDVTIKPGGPDLAPETVIAGGGADVIVDWMAAALVAREKGTMLVNIAQPFKPAGMELICRKYTGIKTPDDFKGKTLGVWFFGNEYPFFAWMSKLGMSTRRAARTA